MVPHENVYTINTDHAPPGYHEHHFAAPSHSNESQDEWFRHREAHSSTNASPITPSTPLSVTPPTPLSQYWRLRSAIGDGSAKRSCTVPRLS